MNPIVINSMEPLVKDPDFKPFPKLSRYSRDVVVTEKLDGTNSSICIMRGDSHTPSAIASWFDDRIGESRILLAGSRNRWITPDNDNHGFARWVHANIEDLILLGDGQHFGEWWGSGIQRGYGLTKGEKRFSLFNTLRWNPHGTSPNLVGINHQTGEGKFTTPVPACCNVVPILYFGKHDSAAVDDCLATLKAQGSFASRGFMNPEGVVIHHIASQETFKKTLDKDDQHKGQ